MEARFGLGMPQSPYNNFAFDWIDEIDFLNFLS